MIWLFCQNADSMVASQPTFNCLKSMTCSGGALVVENQTGVLRLIPMTNMSTTYTTFFVREAAWHSPPPYYQNVLDKIASLT